jgi:hypothetical protein
VQGAVPILAACGVQQAGVGKVDDHTGVSGRCSGVPCRDPPPS